MRENKDLSLLLICTIALLGIILIFIVANHDWYPNQDKIIVPVNADEYNLPELDKISKQVIKAKLESGEIDITDTEVVKALISEEVVKTSKRKVYTWDAENDALIISEEEYKNGSQYRK